jgi:hypothetical protein
MATDADPAELVGRHAQKSLLEMSELPRSLAKPVPLPARTTPGWLVPLGATLTGVTLLLGVALAIFGALDGLASGFDTYSLLALVVGIILASTHWGWVHVAEATVTHLGAQDAASQTERGNEWLTRIAPYSRHEVMTTTEEDGSITILERRHFPVPVGEDAFSFESEIVSSERQPPEAPSAVVAERAELLRRRAAAATERERQRYEVASDAYERSRMRAEDEAERRAAARAASEALTERINANLSDPPLTE